MSLHAGRVKCCGTEQWLEAVAAASAAYLFSNAALFARQLWDFVGSGLSVAAHDRAVFGDESDPRAEPLPAAVRADVSESAEVASDTTSSRSSGAPLSGDGHRCTSCAAACFLCALHGHKGEARLLHGGNHTGRMMPSGIRLGAGDKE